MVLKAVHESLDEIPEQYQDLYTERNGQWELTGIEGVKTTADIDRLQSALTKEKNDHKETKNKLKVWDGLDQEEVMNKLDRYDELEAAAGDKLDDTAIEEMVQKRLNGVIKSRTAPLEREIERLKSENGEYATEISGHRMTAAQRAIHDNLRSAMSEMKVRPEAMEDVLMISERIFTITEDGSITTKDNVGVTPGLQAKSWLQEMQSKRPHWWPNSEGGGSTGSGGAGGIAKNPWSRDHWNLTEQGQYIKEHGSDKAEQAAKAAGVVLGAVKPAAARSE